MFLLVLFYKLNSYVIFWFFFNIKSRISIKHRNPGIKMLQQICEIKRRLYSDIKTHWRSKLWSVSVKLWREQFHRCISDLGNCAATPDVQICREIQHFQQPANMGCSSRAIYFTVLSIFALGFRISLRKSPSVWKSILESLLL